MADLKISELSAAGALDGSELVEVVQSGVNVQTTTQDIADLGGGGGAVTSVNGDTGVVVLGAGDIGFTPGGGIAATDVSGALLELDSEKATTASVALKQDLVNSATVITDAASMDITAIKSTLTTSSATRTFTISYTGDDITLEVTLNAVSSTFTFPAASLCVSEGFATGDNTCPLAGASGDKYLFAIKNVGGNYRVVAKNFGQ